MKRAITIFSLGLVVTAHVFFGGCRSAELSADDMRKLIAAQLPLGSTKDQVSAFLDSRGVSHSDIQPYFELDEAHHRVETRIMTAALRYKHRWLKSQLYMVFNFDEHDRLLKYDVKEVRTGL